MTAQQTFLKHLLLHQDDLRAFIGSLVSDRARRDDVFQEVALTLWTIFDRYDTSRSFGAWARGIAANKILKAKRQDRRFPMPFSPDMVQEILDAFAASEPDPECLRERGLQHCLKKVPDSGQLLLASFYAERLSCADIAKQSDLSVEAIYQQIAKCIEGYLNHLNH